MENLVDHTLRKQLEAQQHQINRLERMVKDQQERLEIALVGTNTDRNSTITNNKTVVAVAATVTNNTVQQNNTIVSNYVTIHAPALPFTRPTHEGGPLIVPFAHIRALFCAPDAKRLYKDWLYAADRRLDFALAAPVVAELMLDVMRHCHTDPEQRNVYLSKKRADQVLVYDGTTWTTRPLTQALREIFDGVTEQLRAADQHTLDPNIRKPVSTLEWSDAARYCDAVQILPHAYEARQETVLENARKPAASHLENVRNVIEAPHALAVLPTN